MNLDRFDELAAEYVAGASIQALAEKRGVATATVRTALIGAGVELRQPGRPRASDAGKVRA